MTIDLHAFAPIARKIVIWALPGVLASVAYIRIGKSPPIADDWDSIGRIAQSVREGELFPSAFQPYASHWSPIHVIVSGFAILLDPDHNGLYAIRTLNAAGLTLGLTAFLWLALQMRLKPYAVAGGLTILVFHQGIIGIEAQWDSIGPMWGDAFGRWAVALTLSAFWTGQEVSRRSATAIALLLLAALASKETSAAYMSSVACVVAGIVAEKGVSAFRERGVLRFTVALVGTSIAFLIARQASGGAVSLGPESRYTIGTPLMWLENAALLGVALLSPMGTLDIFDAWVLRDNETAKSTGVLTLAFAALVLFVVSVGVGVRSYLRDFPQRRRAVLGLLLAVPAAWFPVVLMRHVSELYIGQSVFWVAVLVGFGLQGVAWRRYTWASIGITVALAVHVVGWERKRLCLAESGEYEARALSEITQALQALPPGAIVYVEDTSPPPDRPLYSVYRSRAAKTALLAARLADGVVLREKSEAGFILRYDVTKTPSAEIVLAP